MRRQKPDICAVAPSQGFARSQSPVARHSVRPSVMQPAVLCIKYENSTGSLHAQLCWKSNNKKKNMFSHLNSENSGSFSGVRIIFRGKTAKFRRNDKSAFLRNNSTEFALSIRRFAEGKSDKEILDHLLKNSRYDKRLLPPVDGKCFCLAEFYPLGFLLLFS